MKAARMLVVLASCCAACVACGGSTEAVTSTTDGGSAADANAPAPGTRLDSGGGDGRADVDADASAPDAGATKDCARCDVDFSDGANQAQLALYDCANTAACKVPCAALTQMGDWTESCGKCVVAELDSASCTSKCSMQNTSCVDFTGCLRDRCR